MFVERNDGVSDLEFISEDKESGGSKRPTTTTLRAIHPNNGEVGYLKYHQPRRKADGILVDRLEVHPESRGNGYASALMDEMQRRHPKTPIDHGDRTDDGKGWWAAYSNGKSVRRGRTIAAQSDDTVLLHRGVPNHDGRNFHDELHPTAESWWGEASDDSPHFGQWWDENEDTAKFYGHEDGMARGKPKPYGLVVSAHFPRSAVTDPEDATGLVVASGTPGRVHRVQRYAGNGRWEHMPHTPGMRITAGRRTAEAPRRPDWADGEFTAKGGDRYYTVTEPKAVTMRTPSGSMAGYVNWGDNDVIGNMNVREEHQRRGIATELLRRAREQRPGLQHSDRLSDDARAWLSGIGERTAEAAWTFEHHQPGTTGHRMFGGPPDEPRRHMVEYDVSPDKKIDFGKSGTMSGMDRVERKGGPEAVEKMRAAVFAQHPGHTEYDPQADAEPEKPKRRVYYHGTTVEDVTHVMPASHHGQGVVFPGETDKDYAYATPKLGDAWDYAQKAWDHTGGGRRPRVYQVRPIGGHQHVEKDPQYTGGSNPMLRGNNASDVRSKKGFEVVKEMAWPKHMGDQKDYEESW